MLMTKVTQTVGVIMPADLVYRLAQQCRLERVSRGDVVRRAVNQYLAEQEAGR
ncbi:ribbon-helix-helix protein, CopG family [Mesorhizobium sp. M0808]|uniref:ribbon-helix-helix protein, CopG family n=1 Tax=Mesorhizobium sp. M0808 TaxID=2957002 RepID=UPI0033381D8A